MKKNKFIWIVSIVLPLLVSIPRVLFMMNGKNNDTINSVVEVTVEDTLIRILLLFGFSIVTLKFNLVWLDSFDKKNRMWISMIINISIFLSWILVFTLINRFIYNIYSSVLSPSINSISYFFLWVLLLIISKTIFLIEKSKQDAVEKEVLKQKSLQNELDALKSQINPHFLFNSLNTLSLLVREDQNAAVKFINKLSFLFRYILQSQDQSLVTVEEELKVLDSYVHLIKQRYQENFNISININSQMLKSKIPILALQVLVENAVKHNEISIKKPLYMEFYSENNWIVAKNVLQKRIGNIESTNTGLKNLNTRVKIHMDDEIKIEKNETHFTVKIPTQ
uniref:sensor histidine kinase n=2 Tax=Flavobacterium sp. TaxID=239 RepID=UPI00404B5054